MPELSSTSDSGSAEFISRENAIPASIEIVDTTRSLLTKELSDLSGKLASIATAWQGEGAIAFNRVMQRWNEDATSLIDSLTTFTDALGATQAGYLSRDLEASDALARLTNRLG